MVYELKKISVVGIIKKGERFLFIKRTHTGMADGFYMLPGGHVDQGESVLHATIRELKEELGIDVKEEDLEFKLVESIKTHIIFFFKVKKYEGIPHNMEPEKHDEIVFLSPDHPQIHPFSKKELKLIEQGIYFFPNDKEVL